MKTHTSGFKTAIKTFGRQIDSKIQYTINGVTTTLGKEQLNGVTPTFQSDILKSVMKELDIDSNVDIPIGTELNYQFGLKVGNSYEYLDFGNYIVYSSEKQENTSSYKIICYDKMLNSMKPFEDMGLTYPISVNDYIDAICTQLGLTFASDGEEYANYDKLIPEEYFLDSEGKDIGFTYRDVLDQLAQVTASTICINDDDELEIRYINDTEDTIDEEYLKDVNVNFGENFGPVNTIVLSRSADSDSIHYPAILPANPKEIKISDNQIMNGNDRYIFMPDIYDKLNGLTYFINDYSSTGICYYDVCDRYTVSIGDNEYSCVMFNDTIEITQGLEENINTQIPQQSVTKYEYTSTTDKAIRQTYIIVKKNEGQIEALAEQVIPVTGIKTEIGSVTLENAYNGTLHRLEITGQLSLLFPANQNGLYGYPLMIEDNFTISDDTYISSNIPADYEILYPSNNLCPKDTYITVDDRQYKLDFDFLNYISPSVCDRYVYEDGKQFIERNVGVDSEGEKYPLEKTIIEQRSDILIEVNSNSTITLNSFPTARLTATYLLDNEWTNQFVPEVDAIARINLSPGKVTIEGNKLFQKGDVIDLSSKELTITSDNFSVTKEGKVTATAGDIAGFTIDGKKGFQYPIYAPYDYTQSDVERIYDIYRGLITPTQQDFEKYDLDKTGTITLLDYVNVRWYVRRNITTINPGYYIISIPDNTPLRSAKTGYIDGNGELVNGFSYNTGIFEEISLKDSQYENQINGSGMIVSNNIGGDAASTNISAGGITATYGQQQVYIDTSQIRVTDGTSTTLITSTQVIPGSLEESKKNFEPYKNALEEVTNTDIYKYNYKSEEDDHKKHIGFVIGKDYNYSKDITAINDNKKEIGVDLYSMTSVLWKAVQEQQEIIEQLKERITNLEENNNNVIIKEESDK